MTIKTAQRMAGVIGFGIDRVAREADHAGGRWPVLRLENLDTDLPLPPEAVPATAAALATAKANSWLPFTGDDDLRAAVSGLLADRCGHPYDPETEIVITSGGTEAALDCLLATVDPGDEVILTDPSYAGLVNRVRLAGAVSPRTTAVLLMSPSMPSGAVLDDGDWREIARLCREHDLLLIYDGAMEMILFDQRQLLHPVREPGMAERTLVIGSLSKEFRMIGWRVGWAAGPRALIEAVGWAHVYNTTTPVGIARAGATAVLRGDHAHVAECAAELQRRRDLICAIDLPFIRPGGGWSLLLDVAALGRDPVDVSRALLHDAAIAATPMTGWGADVAARHVRFVYSAEPLERLHTLPERLAAAGLR